MRMGDCVSRCVCVSLTPPVRCRLRDARLTSPALARIALACRNRRELVIGTEGAHDRAALCPLKLALVSTTRPFCTRRLYLVSAAMSYEVVLAADPRLSYTPPSACARRPRPSRLSPAGIQGGGERAELHYGGAFMHTDVANAAVSLAIGIGFRSIAWYSTLSTNVGPGIVSLDDQPGIVVDLYSPQANRNQSVWTGALDPLSTHTVSIALPPLEVPRWLDLDALVLERAATPSSSLSSAIESSSVTSAPSSISMTTSSAAISSTVSTRSALPTVSIAARPSISFSRPSAPSAPSPAASTGTSDRLALAVSLGVFAFVGLAAAFLWLRQRSRRRWTGAEATQAMTVNSWLGFEATETDGPSKSRDLASLVSSAPRRFFGVDARTSVMAETTIESSRLSRTRTFELFEPRFR